MYVNPVASFDICVIIIYHKTDITNIVHYIGRNYIEMEWLA